MLLCMLALQLSAIAQDDDEGPVGRVIETEPEETSNLHITFDDVIMVVLLLVACYVFGKIWKGCSYLLLILAALLFYMTRY